MRNALKVLVPTLILALTATSALAFPGGAGGAGMAPAQNAPAKSAVQGTVVETMDSGGYTYLCVESEGQKTWAAVPGSQVEVGQKVELAPGMVMNNFTSKTLGRTFPAIIFSRGVKVVN